MNACRCNKIVAPLLAVLALLPAAAAWAQSGPPTQLGLPEAPLAEPAPPIPPVAPPVTSAPLAPVGEGEPAVGAAIGLLDEGQGGLGADLWQGSNPSWLASLLPRLPAPVENPALRDLQRRLLLTKAAAPDGASPMQAALLLRLRVAKLREMGFAEEAAALDQAARSGASLASSGDARQIIETHLSANDEAGACAEMDRQLQAGVALDLYLSRALLFCQLQRQDSEGAAIGLDLLRERDDLDGVAEDFVAIAAFRLGETRQEPAIKADPDALNVALLKMAGLAAVLPGEDEEEAQDAAAALASARNTARPLPERIAAAERALAFGLLPVPELAALYRELPPSDVDPFLLAGSPPTPENHAWLYQAASAGQLPERRARLLAAIVEAARRNGGMAGVAALYAPIAAELVPNQALSRFAPTALRLFLAAGDLDRAAAWMELAERSAAPATLPRLRLLARIAGLRDSEAAQYDPVAAWREAEGAPAADADFYYALLDALGDRQSGAPAPGSLAPAEGSPSIIIATAAQNGRRGEAVALALIALKDGAALMDDKGAVPAAIAGLVAVGLKDDAHAIARALALAGGL